MSSNTAFDAIIVGGGHNGLAAAAYLSKAGRKVLLLEKLDHPGGAAVSAQAFDGVDARLSRYSYLVSLLPQQVIDDLGLRIRLARRRYSSYTPDPHGGGERPADRQRGCRGHRGVLCRRRGSRRRIRRLHRVLRRLPPAHRGPLADDDVAAADPLRGEGSRGRGRGCGGAGMP